MPDTATILLAPILILQGKWLRWRLPKLPEAAGDRQGRIGIGNKQPLSLMIVGDSAAAGVGVAQQQQALSGQLANHLSQQFDLTWQLRAQSGLKTAETEQILTGELTEEFDVLVISLGVNDAKSTDSAKRWLQQLNTVVEQLRNETKPRLILIAELPPMGRFPKFPQPLRAWLGWRANTFNRHLRQWVQQQPNTELTSVPELGADLAIDGLHPGANTYRLWGQAVAERITQRLG
ncbi:SGNH/GDSL hydrolase family protein [Ferrimonas lipolytica]|uniref:SGNH/GDSL hydrolase family protein n=1 Tax=Ferrimonas lipolytica TaxID=2724191 RepID=A0A6H1UEW7_9GAMM|nr:SGNH/GDSL hydrolase family protein [Ferrimonas lipolytica]QIZ76883.1 SGNH/GDSL hydrolase family protein [Ferrimonas lipolytica]